jgi:hypothetical protein
MNRREALNTVALLMGGTVIGGSLFLQGCSGGYKKAEGLPLTPQQLALLDEIGETIIPTTNTPGAKAAQIGAFMQVMVTDCYEEKDQKIFLEGMNKLNDAARQAYKNDFLTLSPEQRTALLTTLDKEASDYAKNKKKEEPAHYFTMMKQLTLLGYFTSEVGATQALRYVAVPGKYEGCIEYKKGDRAWAL